MHEKTTGTVQKTYSRQQTHFVGVFHAIPHVEMCDDMMLLQIHRFFDTYS